MEDVGDFRAAAVEVNGNPISSGLLAEADRQLGAVDAFLQLRSMQEVQGPSNWLAIWCHHVKVVRERSKLWVAAERDDTLQRAEALKYRAIIEREQGKLDQAAATLEEAGELAEKGEDKLLRAEILRERGETLQRQGQMAQAKLHLEYAVRQFSDLDAVLDAVDTRQRIKSLAGAA